VDAVSLILVAPSSVLIGLLAMGDHPAAPALALGFAPRRLHSDILLRLMFDGSSSADGRRWCPHQMPATVEAVVLELRRVHRYWGPRRSGTSWSGDRARAGPAGSGADR
jgi:hypothetical protein